MKKALAVVMSVLMVCMFVFVGCGSNDNAGSSLENTTWSLSGAESGGQTVDADQLNSLFGEMNLEFKTEGNMAMTMAGESVDGTYTVEGSKLSMTMSGSTTEATIEGDKITMESSGTKLFFTKK